MVLLFKGRLPYYRPTPRQGSFGLLFGSFPMSYCQMLCIALGGDPFFFYSIDEFNPFDYRCQPL